MPSFHEEEKPWIKNQAKVSQTEPKKPVQNPFINIKENQGKRGLKVGIYGRGGSGKTAFIFSCPQPVFVVDTEMGATPLHMQHPNVNANITEIWEKAEGKDLMERDDARCFEPIMEAVDWLYHNPQQGTLAIDSATDLWAEA